MARSGISCAPRSGVRHAAFAAVASLGLGGSAGAAVVINEFSYDDGGGDDREFIELYNNGAAPVDISGWVVRNADTVAPPGDNNADFTIPASISIPAGGYYVIGQTGVANVNQVVTGTLENDNESIELFDASSAIQDTVIYELNKGPVAVSPGEGGIWGNTQSSDLAGTPLRPSNTLARFVDGRDTNSNGRDFGMRVASPGAANNPTNITAYTTPDPTGQAPEAALGNFAYSFVPPRVIDPTAVSASNPNAIAPSPITGDRAIVAWDPSGGGNGVSAGETFNTPQSSFLLSAYLDTRDTPQQSNATGVTFRGSEISVYGIGQADALSNLTDLSGAVGAPDSANGTTGVAWVYEKVGETTPGAADVSEKLYLVDAGDGGDAGTGGTTPLDWVILATVDLSTTASGWFDLGITIGADGTGFGTFNGQTFPFTTALHSGAFQVGYRENLQIGADTTPDALMRPPTFTIVPEPASLALVGLGLGGIALRRRRNA